jgi:hypothetical protein
MILMNGQKARTENKDNRLSVLQGTINNKKGEIIMHNQAINRAQQDIQTGIRTGSWSGNGFIYELRETSLDFWILFAREWGNVRFQTIAYFNQYGGMLHCTQCA